MAVIFQKSASCGGKSMGAGGRILALPPTGCVTSGKSPTFSVSSTFLSLKGKSQHLCFNLCVWARKNRQ